MTTNTNRPQSATKQWHEDSPHGPRCAQRFHGASECDCGKADALRAQTGAKPHRACLCEAYIDIAHDYETLRTERDALRDLVARLERTIIEENHRARALEGAL